LDARELDLRNLGSTKLEKACYYLLSGEDDLLGGNLRKGFVPSRIRDEFRNGIEASMKSVIIAQYTHRELRRGPYTFVNGNVHYGSASCSCAFDSFMRSGWVHDPALAAYMLSVADDTRNRLKEDDARAEDNAFLESMLFMSGTTPSTLAHLVANAKAETAARADFILKTLIPMRRDLWIPKLVSGGVSAFDPGAGAGADADEPAGKRQKSGAEEEERGGLTRSEEIEITARFRRAFVEGVNRAQRLAVDFGTPAEVAAVLTQDGNLLEAASASSVATRWTDEVAEKAMDELSMPRSETRAAHLLSERVITSRCDLSRRFTEYLRSRPEYVEYLDRDFTRGREGDMFVNATRVLVSCTQEGDWIPELLDGWCAWIERVLVRPRRITTSARLFIMMFLLKDSPRFGARESVVELWDAYVAQISRIKSTVREEILSLAPSRRGKYRTQKLEDVRDAFLCCRTAAETTGNEACVEEACRLFDL